MNYVLAKWIVTSPSGSAAFNEELGQMTLISYPVIAIPTTVMMMAIMYYLWRTIHNMTGLKLEEILVTQQLEKNKVMNEIKSKCFFHDALYIKVEPSCH